MNSCVDIISQKQIIEDTLKSFLDLLDSNLGPYPTDVQKMLKYIHEHLFENTLTIDKVKETCLLTNNNVTTKFRYEVGLGPCEYIRSQRLKVAASILHKREINVYLLATAVGYTEETFSKVFKKAYGESPLQYRQKVLGIHTPGIKEIDKKLKQERILREMDKSL